MSPSNPEDADLVRRALTGDQRACRDLVLRYQRPVFSVLMRVVRRAEDAEDLTQETFVRMFRALDRYDPERPFTAWLFTIATRLAIDHLRRRRVQTVSLSMSRAGIDRGTHNRRRGPGAQARRDHLERRGGTQRPGPDRFAARALPHRRPAAAPAGPFVRGDRRSAEPAAGHRQGPHPPGPGTAQGSRRRTYRRFQAMIHCPESIRAQDYLDGELVPAEREAFEAHLAGCAVCEREVAVYRRVFARRSPCSRCGTPVRGLRRSRARRGRCRAHARRWTPVLAWGAAASRRGQRGRHCGGDQLPGPRAWMTGLLADATRSLASSCVFLLKSLNAGVLHALDSMSASQARCWSSSARSRACWPMSASQPAVAFTLWAAAARGRGAAVVDAAPRGPRRSGRITMWDAGALTRVTSRRRAGRRRRDRGERTVWPSARIHGVVDESHGKAVERVRITPQGVTITRISPDGVTTTTHSNGDSALLGDSLGGAPWSRMAVEQGAVPFRRRRARAANVSTATSSRCSATCASRARSRAPRWRSSAACRSTAMPASAGTRSRCSAASIPPAR